MATAAGPPRRRGEFADAVEDGVGVRLGRDADAVAWLDAYVERTRTRALDPATVDGQVEGIGAWLGECVIAAYGGAWAEVNGGWGVRFDERNAAFPFSKTRKQWENGAEDSILSFYEMIPLIYRDLPGPGAGG
ncbi:MAG TPA: hypothetical protein VHG91_20075 [Longimicrobium sp.]|nr:hypothetical protein [Longimicrobium sp.]